MKIADSTRSALGNRRCTGANPAVPPLGACLLIQTIRSTNDNSSAAKPPKIDFTYITADSFPNCKRPFLRRVRLLTNIPKLQRFESDFDADSPGTRTNQTTNSQKIFG